MRVLLVTHEASLSGAPRIALMAARTMREQGCSVSVVSRRPGPVEAEFRATGPFAVEPLYRIRRRLWRTPRLRRLALAFDTLLALASIAVRRPDLVFLNSTASLVYLRPALWLRRPVVVHAHESAAVADRFVDPTRTRSLLRRAHLSACSPATRADLAVAAGVPVSDVALVLSVPDSGQLLTRADRGLPAFEAGPDEMVIGCCGSVEHRKGADLWLEVEQLVRTALPHRLLRFVWVGPVDPQFAGVAADRFVGASANPYPSMRRFDIATLPSRDDPFPLVVMESMWLGTPVVAFDVGGVAEQVGDGGIVVPPGDTEAFAEALVSLVLDGDRREQLGRAASSRAAQEYSTTSFSTALGELVRSAS